MATSVAIFKFLYLNIKTLSSVGQQKLLYKGQENMLKSG
jgi:hypothetical protein